MVLVLKRLRRRGNGLKSHPTDWEKPGIEPATPGLQDIGLSPIPRWLLTSDMTKFKFKVAYSVTMNNFRKKKILFKSFEKVELSYVVTINLISTAENCMEM